MVFTDRVKELIKEKGITQEQFNRDVDISKNTLSFWEKEGRLPKDKKIAEIAEYFDVSKEYLLGEEGRDAYIARVNSFLSFLEQQGYTCTKTDRGVIISKKGYVYFYPLQLFRSLCRVYSDQEGHEYIKKMLHDLLPSYDIPSEAIPLEKQSLLPVYGEVSAGSGEFAQQLILGYEVADAKYDPKEYFYLLVDGDSMSPLIDDGDYVLVHSQETIESGQIAVCVVDGLGYVKKVELTEESITLISINPYYPPRTFKKYDMNRVRIYGRVLEMKRKF